ncbi:Late embryogenesis abundant protein, LEA-14 [Heracleum sosnowskyi]|uniref:Late embryogenesis abundant protein, LEA-14 n=1 Tax=Heracleum sosnowskyi TaxID=360622 RepID=A0AAD8M4L5_9APIA|nr:Late embryogenesis abundant protein, LEA-14 [Heracleum sosnowskyi]
MSEHQKIHPVQDPEAALQQPTAPLVSRYAARSEGGDPVVHYPPPLAPIPNSKMPRRKRRSCFTRCLCWSLCVLLVILTILGILAAVIFLVFRPKAPSYSVDSIRITQFGLNNDLSLSASFNVNVTARNPNKKIGIYYEGGSPISVWYTGTKLCEGSWPKFYQGHRNTTVLNLPLTGRVVNAADLFRSVQQEQSTGKIPLNVRVRVPVRIKLGKLKLMKWKFLVKCRLVVDTLSADNTIRIAERSCKFRFRL